MASELSTRSERAVARRCWEIMLAGAKADVDATKREVRRSFIVCLADDVYWRSFYEEMKRKELFVVEGSSAEVREFASL